MGAGASMQAKQQFAASVAAAKNPLEAKRAASNYEAFKLTEGDIMSSASSCKQMTSNGEADTRWEKRVRFALVAFKRCSGHFEAFEGHFDEVSISHVLIIFTMLGIETSELELKELLRDQEACAQGDFDQDGALVDPRGPPL